MTIFAAPQEQVVRSTIRMALGPVAACVRRQPDRRRTVQSWTIGCLAVARCHCWLSAEALHPGWASTRSRTSMTRKSIMFLSNSFLARAIDGDHGARTRASHPRTLVDRGWRNWPVARDEPDYDGAASSDGWSTRMSSMTVIERVNRICPVVERKVEAWVTRLDSWPDLALRRWTLSSKRAI